MLEYALVLSPPFACYGAGELRIRSGGARAHSDTGSRWQMRWREMIDGFTRTHRSSEKHTLTRPYTGPLVHPQPHQCDIRTHTHTHTHIHTKQRF